MNSIRRSNAVPRVLHIVPSLFDANDGVVGGAERYALELSCHMASEAPTKLVSFGEFERREIRGKLNVAIINQTRYVRGQRTNPFSLSLMSELRGADVIHCHQQHVISSSIAAAVSRFTGKRVFVSDLGGGGWDVSSYVSTDRWYHGHLHISEYSRKVFGHEKNRRSHVIYGGVNTKKFSPNPGQRAKAEGQRINDKKVLFVGRLLPHKGINYLVEALPVGMSLEIIGQRYDQSYFKEITKLAAGKQVTFRHDCDDDELIKAYREAMCVVLPSVYKDMYGHETKVPELLGQTLLEGMACGTPVICTNVASMPEVVEDGMTGLIVPPNSPAALNQKLNWLGEHPDEARRMGEAGRKRVLEKFTWPQVVKRCLEIYAL